MDDKMKERMERMANLTWQAIADDALEMTGEDMSRDEVIELVCDADRMAMYGDDKKAYKAWCALPSYEEKQKAIQGAFPYELYGY